jgi:hypothetical protein
MLIIIYFQEGKKMNDYNKKGMRRTALPVPVPEGSGTEAIAESGAARPSTFSFHEKVLGNAQIMEKCWYSISQTK